MAKELLPIRRLVIQKSAELVSAGVPEQIAIDAATFYVIQQRAYEASCYQFKVLLKAGAAASSLVPAVAVVHKATDLSSAVRQSVHEGITARQNNNSDTSHATPHVALAPERSLRLGMVSVSRLVRQLPSLLRFSLPTFTRGSVQR
jgi:hypothetical protein